MSLAKFDGNCCPVVSTYLPTHLFSLFLIFMKFCDADSAVFLPFLPALYAATAHPTATLRLSGTTLVLKDFAQLGARNGLKPWEIPGRVLLEFESFSERWGHDQNWST